MKHNKSINSLKSIYDYRKQLILNYGLIAGGIMMAFLLAVEFLGSGGPFINFLSYVPLGIILYMALSDLKKKLPKDKIFIKGIPLGLGISLMAAAIISILNLILVAVAPSHSFQAFGIDPQSLNQEVMMTSIYFVETFVYGAVITFIILQFLKENVRY